MARVLIIAFLICVPKFSFATEKSSFSLCKNALAQRFSYYPSGPEKIFYQSAENDSHFIADISNNGIVTFDVRNRDENNAILSSSLIPSQAVLNVLQFWGDRVVAVRAVWIKINANSSISESRNYFEFMNALKDGYTPEVAVFETWTGRQLRVAGFNRCIDIIYSVDSSDDPFNAWKIFVYFGR